MKRLFSILLFVAFFISFASCASVQTERKKENEIAGYNLKSKKEQMQQKILHKKNKTLIACP